MKYKNLFCYLIIFLFTFTYFFFFKSDTYLIADDTIFHTSNILVMADNISINNLIPDKILPTLVNDLGYGVNIFYPMIPHLIGAYLVKIFSFFDMGIISVMKFIHFMVIFLSGSLMYKYIKEVFKNRKQALITAILYQSTPYLFTDVFMRGAYNESFLFIYLPLIFLSLYYLFETDNKDRFYFYFILGYSLLIYSHLVLALYLTIFIIIYMLVYYKKLFTRDIIKCLILASIIILLITSNFWGPLLEHKLLDIYYIFKVYYIDSFAVKIANIGYYLFPIKYFNIRDDYFLLFFISPICLLLIGCNIIQIIRNKIDRKDINILKGITTFIIISLVIATNSFIWNFIPNILRNIQFSWRLSLFIAFSASIIGGYGIRLFNEKTKKIILIIVIITGCISNYLLSSKLSYKTINEEDLLANSCCHLQWSYEYLPINGYRNALQLYNKTDNISNIKIITNDIPNMKFRVYDIEKEIKVEFPRIYYLGYELKDNKGNKINVYQNNFGLLETIIDKEGIYTLEYNGTAIDRITKTISIVTILLSIFYLIKRKKRG